MNSSDSSAVSVAPQVERPHCHHMSMLLMRLRPAAGTLILLALLPVSFSLMVHRHRHALGSSAHSHSHSHPHAHAGSHQHTHPHTDPDADSHLHLNFCGIELTLPDWFPGIAPQLFSTPAQFPNSLTALTPTISELLRCWNALAPGCLTALCPGPAFCRLTHHDSRLPDRTPDRPPVPPPQRSTQR